MSRLFALVLTFIALASPGMAQPARAYMDVNFVAIKSAQEEHTDPLIRIGYLPIGAAAAFYPELPTATGVQINAGVALASNFGVGVRFSPVRYIGTVRFDLITPAGTDSGTTERALKRKDRAVDLSVVYFVPTPEAWGVRIFGGPSFLKVKQTIDYSHTYTPEEANIYDVVSYHPEDVEASTVGFHLGGDISYFFTDHIGVGGVFSISRGTVEFTDPLTFDDAELAAGQMLFGAGVRFRF